MALKRWSIINSAEMSQNFPRILVIQDGKLQCANCIFKMILLHYMRWMLLTILITFSKVIDQFQRSREVESEVILLLNKSWFYCTYLNIIVCLKIYCPNYAYLFLMIVLQSCRFLENSSEVVLDVLQNALQKDKILNMNFVNWCLSNGC